MVGWRPWDDQVLQGAVEPLSSTSPTVAPWQRGEFGCADRHGMKHTVPKIHTNNNERHQQTRFIHMFPLTWDNETKNKGLSQQIRISFNKNKDAMKRTKKNQPKKSSNLIFAIFLRGANVDLYPCGFHIFAASLGMRTSICQLFWCSPEPYVWPIPMWIARNWDIIYSMWGFEKGLDP